MVLGAVLDAGLPDMPRLLLKEPHHLGATSKTHTRTRRSHTQFPQFIEVVNYPAHNTWEFINEYIVYVRNHITDVS